VSSDVTRGELMGYAAQCSVVNLFKPKLLLSRSHVGCDTLHSQSATLATEATSHIVVCLVDNNVSGKYEGVSKIFRTGAAIYTAVVVARSTGIC
jgi:hypothetical protein